MRLFRRTCLLIVIISAFAYQQNLRAQLFAPNRDWASITAYDFAATHEQDSIFIFYSWAEDPVQGTLRAQFSDSSAASYAWYKYNEEEPISQRFELITGATDSILTDLRRAGYRVEVTVGDSVETYTAWLMIDDVEIDHLVLYNNNCERLTLALFTKPENFYEVNQTYFTYYNYYSTTHIPVSILSTRGYFGDYTFQSIPSDVPVDDLLPFLQNSHLIDIEFENPVNQELHGPLYDASYKLTINTPFGRGNLEVETETITAIATRVDFNIYINHSTDGIPNWEPGGDNPSGEALMEIKLESTSENADSLFWKLNKVTKLYPYTTKVIWSDSAYFENIMEAFPPKELMVPGYYKVEHTAKKVSSGCTDRVVLPFDNNVYLVVDSSFFKDAAIPNVFTPNGSNPVFKFVLPEDNILSIKSFKIVIFSRWGNQVYSYSGDPKTWEGWNGKIEGTKGDAAAGVYYFIIDAEGWDGVRYRRGRYKGFLHLFR